MVGFFIALLSGALMSIQGVFNTEVTKTTGMWVGQISAFGRSDRSWNYTYSNSGNEPAWPGKSSITDCYRTVDRSLWD